MADAAGRHAPLSTLERMPKWLICVPLVLQWIWLSLRYGSVTLPSAANPAIEAGGLVGETKLEYFASMGALASSYTARHLAVPPRLRFTMPAVLAALTRNGITFPLVAKPDLGMCGFGVRLIVDAAALAAYFEVFPRTQTVVLQEYLPQQGEAGVFYACFPGEAQGRIIGLALRYFPQVEGDGESTIDELIAADPRASRVGPAGYGMAISLSRVPDAGETVRLATVGSTRVGGLYRDGADCITPALTAAIHAIAGDMKQFHFGRFDLRFSDLPDLRAGRGLRIMEVNGAGSEAIQAWDPHLSLLTALRIIFSKQQMLFAIAAANRRQGHRPIGLRRLAHLHLMQQRLLNIYPPSN